MSTSDVERRADAYVSARGMSYSSKSIGSGNDGFVWRTSRQSALKVFWRVDTYERELACYQRLRERHIAKLKHFNVPRLIDFDDEFHLIEMEIVSPPYFLDFGKAYVDFRPEYSEDALACWEEQYKELWGEERWKMVRRLMASLTLVGIYYQDPTPRNIHFGESDD
jgi:hypothetical protein